MPYAGDEQQPDGGKWIEQEADIGMERRGRSVVLDVVQVAGVGAQPGVEDLFVRLTSDGARVKSRVLPDGAAGEHKSQPTAPTQTALTVAFCSLRPKKNMMAAPKAGSSGMSQMWSRKNIVQSSR